MPALKKRPRIEHKATRGGVMFRCAGCARAWVSRGPMIQHLRGKAHKLSTEDAFCATTTRTYKRPPKRTHEEFAAGYQFLAEEIERRGLVRSHVAKKMGINASGLSHHLNNYRGGLRTLQRIARALGYEAELNIRFVRVSKAAR